MATYDDDVKNKSTEQAEQVQDSVEPPACAGTIA